MSRLTLRARLTIVYGGLFLLAGVVLLGVTYVLVSQRLPHGEFTVSGSARADLEPPVGAAANQTIVGEVRGEALNALFTQGGIALAVVGAAAIALGWLIAGRVLQPLQRVTETAQRIAYAPAADRGLHERIALNGPHDEIKELADTFDVMLERLDHSFDGQRRFIANASHELRTPLTLNRALLEVAVQRPTASVEVRQLGDTLLGINARHERLIDGLLLLARSERELTEHSYVDIADIVEHVAGQVPQNGVTVLTEPGEAPTAGNPVLLERLVQNLVENGVRYNVPDDGWVGVTSDTHPDGSVVLVVSNTGPVVPRYEIPRLFEPFHRLGEDRVTNGGGAGLGLSIVRAVARAHGGDVDAVPRGGGGLVVTVTLPGAPPPPALGSDPAG
ncbi:sensor histidine kinase [Phytohabitans rumicis]|uniref:sensor histidine kinase n=1 Tax=Phytohabitans rumicis TaxID=1076125 RepID=UPI0015650860|nr:HAMP domain-containing sensor histidine kinase [Phytohabitans rumicis]